MVAANRLQQRYLARILLLSGITQKNRRKMLILLASITFAALLALFLLRKELKTRGFLSTYNRNARSDARLQRSRTIKPHH